GGRVVYAGAARRAVAADHAVGLLLPVPGGPGVERFPPRAGRSGARGGSERAGGAGRRGGGRMTRQVAIIGAGAAGLAAAYDLSRAGYAVTVYEAGAEV